MQEPIGPFTAVDTILESVLHLLLFNPACILKMIFWIKTHLIWLPSCVHWRLLRFFPTSFSNTGVGYRLFCASESRPSLGLVAHAVIFCYYFLAKKNQLPKVIKDLLPAKLKSLNICCGRPWGRTEAAGGAEPRREEALHRLLHPGAVLGEQLALPAIFRRTVWDRKCKQMIYNIKQNVTEIQHRFNRSLFRDSAFWCNYLGGVAFEWGACSSLRKKKKWSQIHQHEQKFVKVSVCPYPSSYTWFAHKTKIQMTKKEQFNTSVYSFFFFFLFVYIRKPQLRGKKKKASNEKGIMPSLPGH